MKLRDNGHLWDDVDVIVCDMLAAEKEKRLGAGQRIDFIDAILDAVERALTTPSPETGTAAVPTFTQSYVRDALERTRMEAENKAAYRDMIGPSHEPAACACASPNHMRGEGCGVPFRNGICGVCEEECFPVDDDSEEGEIRAPTDAELGAVQAAFAGPAPEPVKPPETCAEWCAKGRCEVKEPHEIHFTRNGDYTWRTPAAEPGKPATCEACSGTGNIIRRGKWVECDFCNGTGRTPAAGTAPKGER